MNIQDASHIIYRPEGKSFLNSTTQMLCDTLTITPGELSLMIAGIHLQTRKYLTHEINARFAHLTPKQQEAVKSMLGVVESGFNLSSTFSDVAHIVDGNPRDIQALVDRMGLTTVVSVIPAGPVASQMQAG